MARCKTTTAVPQMLPRMLLTRLSLSSASFTRLLATYHNGRLAPHSLEYLGRKSPEPTRSFQQDERL